MKKFAALALACARMVCADPVVDLKALSYDGDRVLCEVDVTHLDDLQMVESERLYLVLSSPLGIACIVDMGRVTPQTTSVQKVTYLPAEEFESLNCSEVVLSPLQPHEMDESWSKLRYPKQYYDRPHHYDRLGKPYERGLGPFDKWEQRQAAQDASASVDTSKVC